MNDGAMLINKAATDVTLQIKLYDNTTGALKTGITITDLDLYYIRVEDDEDVTISSKADFTALSALTDAHDDNKALEIGQGYYRIDLPDAAFATGATTGSIIIVDGSATPEVLTATIDFQLVDFANLVADSSGRIDVGKWLGTAVTVSAINSLPDVNAEKVADATPMTAANVNTEADIALTDYDPPTRAEATTDKNAIITEVNANETKIDTMDAVADAILADTGTDGVVVVSSAKTGYKLASDGLDSVSTTEPTGVASNFREMIVQIWRRLFGKSTLTKTELKCYKSDGATVVTTQTVSEDGTTQTQGEAS